MTGPRSALAMAMIAISVAQAPTAFPTEAPTASPTESPTAAPTKSPTTTDYTYSPTPAPTPAPSSTPTYLEWSSPERHIDELSDFEESHCTSVAGGPQLVWVTSPSPLIGGFCSDSISMGSDGSKIFGAKAKQPCAAAGCMKLRIDPRNLKFLTVEDDPVVQIRYLPPDSIFPNPKQQVQPKDLWEGYVIEVMLEMIDRLVDCTATSTTCDGGSTYNLRDRASIEDQLFVVEDQEADFMRAYQALLDGQVTTSLGAENVNILFSGSYIIPERLQHMHATSAYSHQPLALLVREPNKHFGASVFPLFKPFSPALWTLILVTVLLGALVFVLIEGDYISSPMFKGEAFQDFKAFRQCYFYTLYISMLSITGSKTLKPVTHLGKVYVSMWAMLAMLLVMSYTAAFAAWLVAQETVNYASTFNDFLSPSLSVCVRQGSAYAQEFMRYDARLKFMRQVPMGSLQDMTNGLIHGQCDGIIERQMAAEYLQKMYRNKELDSSELGTIHDRRVIYLLTKWFGIGKVPTHKFKISDRLDSGPSSIASLTRKNQVQFTVEHAIDATDAAVRSAACSNMDHCNQTTIESCCAGTSVRWTLNDDDAAGWTTNHTSSFTVYPTAGLHTLAWQASFPPQCTVETTTIACEGVPFGTWYVTQTQPSADSTATGSQTTAARLSADQAQQAYWYLGSVEGSMGGSATGSIDFEIDDVGTKMSYWLTQMHESGWTEKRYNEVLLKQETRVSHLNTDGRLSKRFGMDDFNGIYFIGSLICVLITIVKLKMTKSFNSSKYKSEQLPDFLLREEYITRADVLTAADIKAVTENVVQVWKNDILGEQTGLRSMSQEVQMPVANYLTYQMRDTHEASKWNRYYRAQAKFHRSRSKQLHGGALNVQKRFADVRREEQEALSRQQQGREKDKGEKFSRRRDLKRATVLGDLRYYSEEKQYSAEHIRACQAKAVKIGRVEVASAILAKAVEHAIETVQTTIKFTRDSGKSNTFHNHNTNSQRMSHQAPRGLY